MHTLYGSLGAPWTRKVAVVLAEKSLPFERRMDGSRALAAPPDMAPLGKTPVLVLPNGQVLFDSSAIVEALEELHPTPPMLPSDPQSRIDARRWQATADGFADLGVSAAFDDTHAQGQAERQARTLEALGAGLGERAFYCGAEPCIADVAVACALGWHEARSGQSEWRRRYPSLDRLTKALEARPSFVGARYLG